ncbi:MAG: hypothetical protein JW748_04895 [Anaerolineales bacterium]|nr:hypothetical protein [Anaerolineales bacterium]
MNRRTLLLLGIALTLACNLPVAPPEKELTASAAGAVTHTPAGPSPTPTVTPAPEPTPTATRPFPYTIVEPTLYEGDKTYTCDAGGCWRDDGSIAGPPETFYPNIDEDNPEIRALLASIGLPADIASDDAERWRRIRALWEWMGSNTVVIGDPAAEEPWYYLQELTALPLDHWPSIGEMAKVYARFGVLPLGACNSKAFTAATLLYRAGVRPDSITVAHSQAHDGTQHLYLAFRLEGRWRYVDPTCIRGHAALSPQPETVGCVGADYKHPYDLVPLPGSLLAKPMLLE